MDSLEYLLTEGIICLKLNSDSRGLQVDFDKMRA